MTQNSPTSSQANAQANMNATALSEDPLPVLPASNAVNATRWLAVASLVGLIVLCAAWELFLAPLRPNGSLLALKALPLCIPLAGLLKNKMYTYRWVSLMVWVYFTEGAVRAYSDKAPSNYYAMLEVVLCLCLFVACALHVRLRFKAHRAAGMVAP